MPGIAGALTGLGLLALPAVPSPTYFASKSAADTWSITETDGASAVGVTPPVAKSGSDAWSLGFIGDSGLVGTYPSQTTQLSLLALPGKYSLVTAKAVTSLQSIAALDGWALGWQEHPFELNISDTWDAWALTFSLQAATVSVSQTFSANETWSLNWLDVGSVFAGGPIPLAPTDTWALTLTDVAVVAATADAADTWSLQITDSGVVWVSSDTKTSSDTWSLAFAFETGFFSPVVDIPILGSDEWDLLFAGTARVVPFGDDQGTRRIVLIRAVNRIVRKQ